MARVKPFTTWQPKPTNKASKDSPAKDSESRKASVIQTLHKFFEFQYYVATLEEKYLHVCATGASKEVTSDARLKCVGAQEQFDKFRAACHGKYPERKEFLVEGLTFNTQRTVAVNNGSSTSLATETP